MPLPCEYPLDNMPCRIETIVRPRITANDRGVRAAARAYRGTVVLEGSPRHLTWEENNEMRRSLAISLLTVLVGFSAWAEQPVSSENRPNAKGQAPGPEFPQVALGTKLLKATAYLPDAEKGFYRGTRFDWSGMIAQVEYQGHTFFGELKAPHDPLIHDHTVGPCEEFGQRNPLGYAEAAGGETFIKIGIGLLRKPPNEKQYSFARAYEIVRPGAWNVETAKDRIRFRQTLGDPRGWGYEYEKEVVLLDHPPAMKITHTFKNTGTKRIETDHYNHSMYILDGEPIGKNYRLLFPFTPTGEIRNPEQARLDDKSLVFLEDAVKRPFYMELKGYGDTARDNCVIVENTRSGVQLKMTVDQPLSTCRVYAENTSVCPEPFVAVRVAPGESFTWTTTLEFIVP